MKKKVVNSKRTGVIETNKALHDFGSFVLQAENVLTRDEAFELIGLVNSMGETGKVGVGGGEQIDETRRSKVYYINYPEHRWLFKRLWQAALLFNKTYQFDIIPNKDFIQVAYYDESEEGFYDAHMDIGPEMFVRKLSMSIPLNDVSEYEGGELEFYEKSAYQAHPQKVGAAIAFPSFLLHRVNPVTKGRRYSMVVWFCGPCWQ